ncbi:MAG TPA: PilZ domain-containing protein, partial [Vicinamibacteria bacterium]|nr:PilZ domain-containing protein [Vicinamibacteria bacterium]
MARALICTQADLSRDLSPTVLWREGVERLAASSYEEARTVAIAARPELVVVDRDLPRAAALVSALRADESTRRSSIAVVARGDVDTADLELLEAGANAVLRLPAGADWDDRLMPLLTVPTRRESRVPVWFRVQAVLPPSDNVRATALNLSRSGLLLETRLGALAVGEEVDLQVNLPGGEEPLPAEGRVV